MKMLDALRVRSRTGRQIVKGAYEYYARPEWRNGFGGPFNGQRKRQELFVELIRRLEIDGVVETGTFRGTTTEYMRQASGLPVHSAELNPQNFGFCLMRFIVHPHVHLFLGDSRAFLRRLAARGLRGQLFFYLDAHWNSDLPLREEVALIFRAWPTAVIMIDDFQVPDDAGFGYDDYGPGKALTLDYLGVGRDMNVYPYFPALGASEETGAKRGSVILASDMKTAEALKGVSGLRIVPMESDR